MGEHEHSIDIGAVTDAVLAAILASPGRGGIPEGDEGAELDARERIRARVEAAASEPGLDAPGARLARLSELLGDDGWSGPVSTMSHDPFGPPRKPRRALPLIAALLAAGLVAAALLALSPRGGDPAPAPAEVTLSVDAPGLGDGAALPGALEVALEGAAPLIVDFDSDSVILGELEPGDYEVSLLETPVLADGTTFAMADGAAFTVGDAGDPEGPRVELEAVMLDELPGEARASLAGRAEKARDEALAALLRGEPIPEDPEGSASGEDAPSDEAKDDPAAIVLAQKPDGKPSKPAGSHTSSKPSGGSNSSAAAKPSHKHTWVEQTTQKWVPDNVWVVDKPAWDEVVPGRSYILCTCGSTFNTNAEWSAHNKSAMLAGDKSHRSSVETEYTTIHHDEVGHWEDRGHNETVVTGYTCSGCGAKK